MSVRVLFFGATAEATGKRVADELLEGQTTVGALLNKVVEKHPVLSGHKLLVAVNEEYCSQDRVLAPGDEVAIFTAVSGG